MLLESLQAFRSIAESAVDAIVCANTAGQIIFWNSGARQMFGYEPEEVLGKSLNILIPPRYRAAHDAGIARMAAGGQARVIGRVVELEALRGDGTEFPIELALSTWTEGGTIFFGAILRDITVRKQAREQLERMVEERTKELQIAKEAAEQASQAKSQFLANMSHELRTPLTAIIGYSEMLLEDAELDGNEAQVTDLRKIQRAGKHLLGLINDILDMSKIEAGKMQLDLESFPVAPFASEVMDTCRPLAERNHNKIILECAPDVGEVYGDKLKIRQALFNLVSNACKFTEGGDVSLQISREQRDGADWIRMVVQDTGIGISADNLHKLFSNFTQAESSTSSKYGGTGLGLALSQKLCNLMGGHITVNSRIGLGSVFTIHLPVNEPAPRTADNEADDLQDFDREAMPDESEAGEQDQPVVLFVDDDPAARELVHRVLSKEGFRPVIASSADEGLRLARERKPDVIVLDVLMPSPNGWQLLQTIKADPVLKDCPVVMLTMVDDRDTSVALGAVDYLLKPIDRAALVASLERLCGDRKRGHILVVDDEPDIRQLVSRTLSSEGWVVETAPNGAAAIERIAVATPQLVLLDLMMPKLDGFGVVEQMRGSPAWADLPVIVFTSKDVTGDDRQRLAGVSKILTKGGYDAASLIGEVRKVVNTRKGRAPSTPVAGTAHA